MLGPERKLLPRCSPACDVAETPRPQPGLMDDPVEQLRITSLLPAFPAEARQHRLLVMLWSGVTLAPSFGSSTARSCTAGSHRWGGDCSCDRHLHAVCTQRSSRCVSWSQGPVVFTPKRLAGISLSSLDPWVRGPEEARPPHYLLISLAVTRRGRTSRPSPSLSGQVQALR
jgi:hypothetical protein